MTMVILTEDFNKLYSLKNWAKFCEKKLK